MTAFPTFHERYAASRVAVARPVEPELLTRYQGRLPPALLEEWGREGLYGVDQGFIERGSAWDVSESVPFRLGPGA